MGMGGMGMGGMGMGGMGMGMGGMGMGGMGMGGMGSMLLSEQLNNLKKKKLCQDFKMELKIGSGPFLFWIVDLDEIKRILQGYLKTINNYQSMNASDSMDNLLYLATIILDIQLLLNSLLQIQHHINDNI